MELFCKANRQRFENGPQTALPPLRLPAPRPLGESALKPMWRRLRRVVRPRARGAVA